MQIYDKNYGETNPADSYARMTSDLTTLYAWDEIDTSESGKTTFKKYQPNNAAAWCGITITETQYNPYVAVTCAAADGNVYKCDYVSNYTGQDNDYTVIAVTDAGIVLYMGGRAFPFLGTAGSGIAVGVCSSTNAITGEKGFSAFGADMGGSHGIQYISIHGANTVSAINSKYIRVNQQLTPFNMAVPFTAINSADVLDNIFLMTYRPEEDIIACKKTITINNKKFLRLGYLLIPY